MNEDGIIRSNSRLANATVSKATKKAIILDGRNRIIRLFLELQHNINGHVGLEQQIHIIQLDYWVLQCKTRMKRISNKYECRRQTTQQPASDVRSSELTILSQTCSLQRNGSWLFWAFWNLQPNQHSHESLLLLIHLSNDTSRSYRSDQELAKGIMHNGIPTILQPTRNTGKNSQWQRFKFHQYSQDLPGKQLHNYRATEICGVKKHYMEIYSTRSNTFWWNMGTPHWDE